MRSLNKDIARLLALLSRSITSSPKRRSAHPHSISTMRRIGVACLHKMGFSKRMNHANCDLGSSPTSFAESTGYNTYCRVRILAGIGPKQALASARIHLFALMDMHQKEILSCTQGTPRTWRTSAHHTFDPVGRGTSTRHADEQVAAYRLA